MQSGKWVGVGVCMHTPSLFYALMNVFSRRRSKFTTRSQSRSCSYKYVRTQSDIGSIVVWHIA